MSLWDNIRGFFYPTSPPIVDERALTYAKIFGTGQDTAWWTSLSSADQPVTAQTIMGAAVGAALRLLADDISALPLDAYRRPGEEGDAVHIELPDWLERPSGQPWDTHTDLISDSVMSLHDGNIFYHCLPNTMNIRFIEVLDPTVTSVEQDRTTGQRIYRNPEVSATTLGADRIVHIPWLRLPGQLRGISPTDALKQAVGSEVAARKWSGAFFANGASLGGIVSVPGGPETVDAKALGEQFASRHAGENNWWKPAVLTGGATFDATTPTPKEADLGPLFAQSVETAARFFHIPPHLLASQMAGAVSYASVEQRSIEYVQHAVVPITTRIERVLSRMLAGDDTYVKLNVTGLLRGDATARAEFYRTLAELKVVRPKQIAALEDLPPSQAADGFYETPNNTVAPPPADEGRSLNIDTVTIGDESAERIADTAAAGAAVAAAEARKLAETVSADVRGLTETVRAQAAEIATLRDDREAIEALLAQRNMPPDVTIDGDNVYYRRGDEVIRKRVQRDERGKVVGMVAA